MDLISLFRLFMVIFIGCMGFIIGSFLNVCIYRIPERRTVVKGHSMCMSCGHTLGPLDLVPLFSWIFLRGKCRYCKAPIASRYAIIEGVTGICFALLAWQRREFFYLPYVSKGFPWNTLILVTLLFISAVVIVAMMIQKDKGRIGRGFFHVIIGATIFRLLLSILSSPFYPEKILLSGAGYIVSVILFFVIALIVPVEIRTNKEMLSDIIHLRTARKYFSQENSFLPMDLFFVALCGALGLPAALPALMLYPLARVLAIRPSVRPYIGIILAAGALIGVVCFPFYLF